MANCESANLDCDLPRNSENQLSTDAPQRFLTDHRRFAIALSTDLPALTYYNPLLNHPSSSEYVASVRSSLRSSVASSPASSQLKIPHFVASVPIKTGAEKFATILSPEWNLPDGQVFTKTGGMKGMRKPPEFLQADRINKHQPTDHKSFCRSVVYALIFLLFIMGSVASIVLYILAGHGGFLFNASSSIVYAVYGEFQIVNHTVLAEMEDGNSTALHAIASQLQTNINQMFYNSTLLGELYNRSEVISISSTSSSLQKPVVRIQLKILLNRPDVMIAEKMALVFVNNLQQKEDSRFLEGLSVNLTSIKFTETAPTNVMTPVSPNGIANWSEWTEWTPECPETPCNESRLQTRNRRCLLRENGLFPINFLSNYRMIDNISPCLSGSTISAADVQLRQCHQCSGHHSTSRPQIPFSVARLNKSTSNRLRFDDKSMMVLEKTCNQCRQGEVCVARLEEVIPVCRWPPDLDDRSGCGGFCRVNTEVCMPFGSNSFRCEELNFACLPSEWRCNDGFCIAVSKRCDGFFNCLDQSDERQCGF